MEINKLRTFLNLADTGSFSKTAENLYIGQSSVSKHINSLEKEFGHKLFIRNNKNTVLSEYGKIVYPYAKKLIEANNNMFGKIRSYEKSKRSMINLGVIPTFTKYEAFRQITTFIDSNPDIQVNIIEMESTDLLPKLKERKIDLAFIRSFEFEKINNPKILVQKEKFKLWVPKGHRLAGQKTVNLNQIKLEKFIILKNNSLLKQLTIDLCRKEGFSPNIVFTSERMNSIEDMVANKQGVSIEMGIPVMKQKIDTLELEPSKESQLLFVKNKLVNNKKIDKMWTFLQENSKVE